MNFRNELKTPLERFLKRPLVRRRDPAAVKAILADPKKLALLQADVDKMAGNTGFRKRFQKMEGETPAEGRLQKLIRYLIDNQDQIFALIARIMALFGAMEAKATK